MQSIQSKRADLTFAKKHKRVYLSVDNNTFILPPLYCLRSQALSNPSIPKTVDIQWQEQNNANRILQLCGTDYTPVWQIMDMLQSNLDVLYLTLTSKTLIDTQSVRQVLKNMYASLSPFFVHSYMQALEHALFVVDLIETIPDKMQPCTRLLQYILDIFIELW